MAKLSDPKIEAYIASKQVAGEMTQRTAVEYRRDLERMGKFLEKKTAPPYYRLYDATKHDINIFLNQIRENNTVPSASRKLAAIKGFFQFLMREGYRSDNPTDHVQLPKVERSVRESVLTREQIKGLLNAPSKNHAWRDFGLRDRAMLHFLYSGPKRQELCDARVSDVDLDNKTIAVNGRSVPLSKDAAAAIGAYLKVRPETNETALFLTNTNAPMKVRNAWSILKKHVKKCKLPKNTDIETLRASYAVLT